MYVSCICVKICNLNEKIWYKCTYLLCRCDDEGPFAVKDIIQKFEQQTIDTNSETQAIKVDN